MKPPLGPVVPLAEDLARAYGLEAQVFDDLTRKVVYPASKR